MPKALTTQPIHKLKWDFEKQKIEKKARNEKETKIGDKEKTWQPYKSTL